MHRKTEALQDTAPAFGVATIDEALELRQANNSHPLLVLEGVITVDAIEAAAANDISLMVNSEQQFARLLEAGSTASLPIWLKIDTGMHRLGLAPGSVAPIVERLTAAGGKIAGLLRSSGNVSTASTFH